MVVQVQVSQEMDPQFDRHCLGPSDVEDGSGAWLEGRGPLPSCPVIVDHYANPEGCAGVSPPVQVDRLWKGEQHGHWEDMEEESDPL